MVSADEARRELARRELERRRAAKAEPSAAAQEFAGFAGRAIQNPARAKYDELPEWKKAVIAATDIMQLTGAAPLMGWGEKAVAGMRAPFTEKTYEEELAEQRRQTNAARRRSGLAGTAAEAAGAVSGALGLANRGATLAGKAGTAAMEGFKGLAARTGLMGAEGAGYGLVNALGEDQDPALGALMGLAAGMGGNVAGETISAAGTKLARAWQNFRAAPSDRAKLAVINAARDAGVDRASAERILNEMGPDAMLVDALGKRGTSLARTASNVSPEARETLESAVLGRKAGQNERVVDTILDAAGLPAGSRQTVKELQRETYKRAAPEINAAYNEARAAGFDLPRAPFQDILESPMGRDAYEESAKALKNRAAVDGMDAASELARLDQTKRILDDKASAAYRAGQNDLGDQAAALAKKLREQMDASIAGPEYAKARGLRQRAYRNEESIKLGSDLARGRVASNLPGQARAVSDAENLVGLQQGYALQQAENLLNRNSTEGALNALSTPLGRESYEAAFRGNAGKIGGRLKAEKAFNATAKDVTGNSTTARQIAEMAGGGAGAGGILALLTGQDPLALGTAGGLLGAGRRAAPLLQRHLATKGKIAMAPEVADLLVRRLLPANPLPTSALERLSKAERDALSKAITILGINTPPLPQ